jgi:Zn-dependent protease with chaperone function
MRRSVTALGAVAALALTVTAAHAGLDRSIEKMLGKQARDAIESEYTVIGGPAGDYVQRMGRALVAVQPRHDIEFTFKIIDTDQVNAFALPWGYVYVTSGMLRFVNSSDELAGVIGHEVSHVAERHAVEQFKQQFWTSLLLGVINAPAAALTAGRLGSTLYLLRHSRKDEQAADRLGATYAYLAGFDASQLSDFLGRLDQANKREPSKLEVYLSTHPTGERRLERLAQLPQVNGKDPQMLIRSARGLLDRHATNQAVVQYRRALALAPNDVAGHAGLALAYAELGAADLARRELALTPEIGAREREQVEQALAASAPDVASRDRIAAATGTAVVAATVRAATATTGGGDPAPTPTVGTSDAFPPSAADKQRLKDTMIAAATWGANMRDPARTVEQQGKALGERVRALVQRMNVAGTMALPSFGGERILEKAEQALYLIAQTGDEVNAVAKGLKATSSGAAQVLTAIERAYDQPASGAPPAGGDDQMQRQALVQEISDGVARAKALSPTATQQALDGAKRADAAAGQLASALNAMTIVPGDVDVFGRVRMSPFMNFAESDVDRAISMARDALATSRKASAALAGWSADQWSWQLSAAYLAAPAAQRSALRSAAAAMLDAPAPALAPERGAGFGAMVRRTIVAKIASGQAQAGQAVGKSPLAATDKQADGKNDRQRARSPTGEELMLKLILAEVEREAAARSKWAAAPAASR